MEYILCSECFIDQGLKLDALKNGVKNNSVCPNCKKSNGKKLNKTILLTLVDRFFVRGTLSMQEYGGAPLIVFNNSNTTDIEVSSWLENDIKLFEKYLNLSFFYYGPRLWMIGEVEPLKKLQSTKHQKEIIKRILTEYPSKIIDITEVFYRLRINPEFPDKESQYDSPPKDFLGKNRLDSENLPILYGSQDLEVCVHECRVTVEDNIYMATLQPNRKLKLLDLTAILDDNTTEFESLDIAIHMLFLAKKHSYEICRKIAFAAKEYGYDGIIYPSYFSIVRTGTLPFATIYGISIRKLKELQKHAKAQIIENIALFDRPIKNKIVSVKCINRIILNQISYDLVFGPVQ